MVPRLFQCSCLTIAYMILNREKIKLSRTRRKVENDSKSNSDISIDLINRCWSNRASLRSTIVIPLCSSFLQVRKLSSRIVSIRATPVTFQKGQDAVNSMGTQHNFLQVKVLRLNNISYVRGIACQLTYDWCLAPVWKEMYDCCATQLYCFSFI